MQICLMQCQCSLISHTLSRGCFRRINRNLTLSPCPVVYLIRKRQFYYFSRIASDNLKLVQITFICMQNKVQYHSIYVGTQSLYWNFCSKRSKHCLCPINSEDNCRTSAGTFSRNSRNGDLL